MSMLLVAPVHAKSPIAEVICEPTGRMHEKLSRQFGSQQTASGIRGPEQIMEVWTSERGDWTLVMTYATGTSCIVAMGENWNTHAKTDPARG
ncbi:hypothetical protein E1297_48165 [Roseibium sp. RKSG952]|nr:hypothetical protein [Roseibium sp. RKSG952]